MIYVDLKLRCLHILWKAAYSHFYFKAEQDCRDCTENGSNLQAQGLASWPVSVHLCHAHSTEQGSEWSPFEVKAWAGSANPKFISHFLPVHQRFDTCKPNPAIKAKPRDNSQQFSMRQEGRKGTARCYARWEDFYLRVCATSMEFERAGMS